MKRRRIEGKKRERYEMTLGKRWRSSNYEKEILKSKTCRFVRELLEYIKREKRERYKEAHTYLYGKGISHSKFKVSVETKENKFFSQVYREIKIMKGIENKCIEKIYRLCVSFIESHHPFIKKCMQVVRKDHKIIMRWMTPAKIPSLYQLCLFKVRKYYNPNDMQDVLPPLLFSRLIHCVWK